MAINIKKSIIYLILITSIAVIVTLFAHNHTNNATPKMPPYDQIIEIRADTNGALANLPSANNIIVGEKYYCDIYKYFHVKSRTWEVDGGKPVAQSRLGRLYFYLKNGEYLSLDFYTAGKGVIGYSIGNSYFIADIGSDDGGISLLFMLDEFR